MKHGADVQQFKKIGDWINHAEDELSRLKESQLRTRDQINDALNSQESTKEQIQNEIQGMHERFEMLQTQQLDYLKRHREEQFNNIPIPQQPMQRNLAAQSIQHMSQYQVPIPRSQNLDNMALQQRLVDLQAVNLEFLNRPINGDETPGGYPEEVLSRPQQIQVSQTGARVGSDQTVRVPRELPNNSILSARAPIINQGPSERFRDLNGQGPISQSQIIEPPREALGTIGQQR